MTLPSATIKIGYRNYSVETIPEREASVCIGQCDLQTGTLRLYDGRGPRKLANTFLHEMLHACYYEWTMEDDDTQERIVLTLSKALCTVFVDNPDWLAWYANLLGQ